MAFAFVLYAYEPVAVVVYRTLGPFAFAHPHARAHAHAQMRVAFAFDEGFGFGTPEQITSI